MRRPRVWQTVEACVRPFDNTEREWVLRLRLWRMDWFPYRTAEWLGLNNDETDVEFGPWEWQPPRKWRKWKRARDNRKSVGRAGR